MYFLDQEQKCIYGIQTIDEIYITDQNEIRLSSFGNQSCIERLLGEYDSEEDAKCALRQIGIDLGRNPLCLIPPHGCKQQDEGRHAKWRRREMLEMERREKKATIRLVISIATLLTALTALMLSLPSIMK